MYIACFKRVAGNRDDICYIGRALNVHLGSIPSPQPLRIDSFIVQPAVGGFMYIYRSNHQRIFISCTACKVNMYSTLFSVGVIAVVVLFMAIMGLIRRFKVNNEMLNN